jgi:hypothetical protein
LPSLIACPGCNHKLTLPETFIGRRVQCPRCSIEFEAVATPVPAMEVEPSTVDANPSSSSDEPTRKDTNGPLPPPVPAQGAYAPFGGTKGRTTASDGLWTYCAECGVKYPRSEDECPACGYRVDDFYDPQPRDRRRRLPRVLPPLNGMLPIIAAILIPVGIAFFIGAPIMDDVFRRQRDLRTFLTGSFVLAGCLTELIALGCGCIWLYQAWRLVLHGDEDYSPGLMVGLLFVPFFNFYWIFRAVPGLSVAIQDELRRMAPMRPHGAGWAAGLIGCIFFLIPYGQPIALCIFLAWMLIANNALHRLIRYQEDARRDALRGQRDEELELEG